MIVIRLDRVLADRKMKLNDLAARVGISNVNLSDILEYAPDESAGTE